jgi:hypothetical protein
MVILLTLNLRLAESSSSPDGVVFAFNDFLLLANIDT